MPKQVSLLGSGVLLHSPLEGQFLPDLTLITPGFARSYPVSCTLFSLTFCYLFDPGGAPYGMGQKWGLGEGTADELLRSSGSSV